MSEARIYPCGGDEYSVIARFRDAKLGDGRYIFTFPSLEAARDFCVCCGFTWALTVMPGALKPPSGSA